MNWPGGPRPQQPVRDAEQHRGQYGRCTPLVSTTGRDADGCMPPWRMRQRVMPNGSECRSVPPCPPGDLAASAIRPSGSSGPRITSG